MTREEAHARLQGLFNITVTPFAKDGALNHLVLAESIERLVSLGYDGVLIGGTYGEFASMTAAERADLFRTAIEAAGPHTPVLLCTADSNVSVVRELTALAASLGGIPMVMPPFVSEVNEEQIEAFFRSIAPLATTGLVIYNAPGVGVTLSPALVERLVAVDGIIGLKQGDLAPTVVDQLIGRLRGRIRLLCASDLQMTGPAAAGFDGLTSTNSGALPELILETYHAFTGGDARRGGELCRRWFAYREFARRSGQPQTVKGAMNLRGWRGGHVRAPLRDLTSAEMDELGGLLNGVVSLRSAA